MTDDLTRLPAAEIARRVRQGELSAVAVAEAFLARAGRLGPKLNTWIRLDREGALRAARAVDQAAAAKRDPGPLAGVPVGIKDLVDLAGLFLGAVLPVWASRPPPSSTSVQNRVRATRMHSV